LGTASWAGHADGVQRPLGELDFGSGGAIEVEAQGKPVAVDDEHPLRPLPLLGEPNLVAALLGRRERTVEAGHGPVELAAPVERREGSTPDALPHAFLSPAFESPPHGGGRAILARQVLPAAARDEHVQDAVNSTAVGRPRAASAGRGRQQGADEGPLHVSEMNPVHAIRLFHPANVSEPPLWGPLGTALTTRWEKASSPRWSANCSLRTPFAPTTRRGLWSSKWIEVFSNRQRRHSALGSVAPATDERTVTPHTTGVA